MLSTQQRREAKKIFFDWCIEQHAKINHMYAGYIPYRFHLELCDVVAKKYKYLWKDEEKFDIVLCGIYAHDVLENCSSIVSYNDLVEKVGEVFGTNDNNVSSFPFDYRILVAEMSFALADNKGRNREERHDAAYFKMIGETEGARFGKLIDRLANVHFGKLMGGTGMFKKYQKEYTQLSGELYTDEYEDIWTELFELLFVNASKQ